MIAKQKYKYPLVYIEWDDAETDQGWEEVPKTLEVKKAITVGFLIKETEGYILVASSYDDTNTNGRIQIPKSIILKRKVII